MAEIVRVEERVVYVNDIRLTSEEVTHIRDLLGSEPADGEWEDVYLVFRDLAR